MLYTHNTTRPAADFVTREIIGTCPTEPRRATSLQECHYTAPNDRDIIINRDLKEPWSEDASGAPRTRARPAAARS